MVRRLLTSLTDLSSYKVDDKYSIIYADILKNSLRSFDFTVWSVVVIVLFIFAGLLFLRQLLNSSKEDKKQGNDLEDSPFFETFSQPTLESGQSRSPGEVSSGFLWSSSIVTSVDLVFHGIRLR